MPKPTMQELAQAAGVSRVTVWKVLSDQPGVSPEKRDQVRKMAKELGYTIPSVPEETEKSRTISLVVSRPESSSFWMNIIHHIAKELSKHSINMLYTYMPAAYREGYHMPVSLSPASVQGCIVLNMYDERLLRQLVDQHIPTVFLDTVPGLPFGALKGDLVLLDGRQEISEITERLLSSGRRRLGFIGDVDYALTNQERFSGFMDAHRCRGCAPDPGLCLTGRLSLNRHYEEISAYLDALPQLPDAFVCASDFIAHFVGRYLAETGRKTPEGFVLTGFDNNPEYANVADAITTVNVDTSALGRLLARKIIYRSDYPTSPTELSYVRTEILWRGPLSE